MYICGHKLTKDTKKEGSRQFSARYLLFFRSLKQFLLFFVLQRIANFAQHVKHGEKQHDEFKNQMEENGAEDDLYNAQKNQIIAYKYNTRDEAIQDRQSVKKTHNHRKYIYFERQKIVDNIQPCD